MNKKLTFTQRLLKLTLLLPIFLFIISFTACNRNGSYLDFKNNIDDEAVWTDHPPSNFVVSSVAHSGKYVCILDSTNPYSVTFYKQLKSLSSNKLKTITISGYFWLNGYNTHPDMVLDIKDKNENSIEVLSKHINTSETNIENWIHFTTTFDLNGNNRNNPENYFRIYAVNTAKTGVLADDLEVSFTE